MAGAFECRVMGPPIPPGNEVLRPRVPGFSAPPRPSAAVQGRFRGLRFVRCTSPFDLEDAGQSRLAADAAGELDHVAYHASSSGDGRWGQDTGLPCAMACRHSRTQAGHKAWRFPRPARHRQDSLVDRTGHSGLSGRAPSRLRHRRRMGRPPGRRPRRRPARCRARRLRAGRVRGSAGRRRPASR